MNTSAQGTSQASREVRNILFMSVLSGLSRGNVCLTGKRGEISRAFCATPPHEYKEAGPRRVCHCDRPPRKYRSGACQTLRVTAASVVTARYCRCHAFVIPPDCFAKI